MGAAAPAFWHVWHFSLYIFPPSRFFFFLLPVAIPYRGLSLRNVAFASCSRKIQILSRVCKNIPRSRRSRVSRPFVAFFLSLLLYLSLSPSLALALSFYLSAFPRYWDASAGFRQARMPLSALTVPLGSSPFPNPGMEDPSARAATRSMRNAGSDEKEDWLETEFVSASEDGGTPTLERAI